MRFPRYHVHPDGKHRAGLPTLIVGAGSAGRTLARDLRHNTDYGLTPIGFVDDDVRKRSVDGLPVFGGTRDIGRVSHENRVEAVVLAIPSLPATRLRTLIDCATECGVLVRYLPSFTAALERSMRAQDLRDVPLADLIHRDEVHIVRPRTRNLTRGRRVLVTGAGGSIGSELCRQLSAFAPASLHMLDHDESNLHGLQLEINGHGLLNTDDIVVADIRDKGRIESVFRAVRPQIVYHAAAHKHLPLLERHPCEGVKTNVRGTHNVMDAAIAAGCERFIFISTDKAASPTSVLGATKRLGEYLLRAHSGGAMQMASVRFGNVLGSRGSLLSVLRHQLIRGEAVTVTHPDVNRYFMTIEEAVGLVLEAGTMAGLGETFVLDMGAPVSIVELTENYAAHLGYEHVDIRFTGLRPGEKLHESLFDDAEERIPTAHPKISAARAAAIPDNFDNLLDDLYRAADENEADDIRMLLRKLVPAYTATVYGEPTALLTGPYPDGF